MKKRVLVEQSTVTCPQTELHSLRMQLAAERRRYVALKARHEVAMACVKAHEKWHDERRQIT